MIYAFKKLNEQAPTQIAECPVSDVSMDEDRSKPLPILVWLVFLSTIVALFGGEGLLGFKMSGLAWFIPVVFSILTIIRSPEKVKFPVWIWLPWIILLIIHLVISEYKSLQRTVQLMCPIVVGVAVSVSRIDQQQIEAFISRCKHLAVALVLIALWQTGTLLTGVIPAVTGLAPHAITAVLLCAIFVAGYGSGRRKDIFWWVMMVGVPLFALTRMATAVAGMTLPLTFSPLKFRSRMIFLLFAIFAAIVLFYTPRMQKKMFYTGKGEIEDIQSLDFADSGRKFMWTMIKKRIRNKPWVGHGTGSAEDYIMKLTGGVRYPHNDWLLTSHDQGRLGVLAFVSCVVMAALHAMKKAKHATEAMRILFFAGASAFVSMGLMMITDNIMVYASYFGNLHFTILGLAYAADRSQPLILMNS